MKHTNIILLIILVGLLFILTGCGKLPNAPEVYQCALDGSPRAFYCVNSKTNEQIKLPLETPIMKGAQCMSLTDFRNMAAWVESLKELADRKCK